MFSIFLISQQELVTEKKQVIASIWMQIGPAELSSNIIKYTYNFLKYTLNALAKRGTSFDLCLITNERALFVAEENLRVKVRRGFSLDKLLHRFGTKMNKIILLILT